MIEVSANTLADRKIWGRCLRGYQNNGIQGFGTGSIGLEDDVGTDGHTWGFIGAVPFDLCVLSLHFPSPLGEFHELVVKAQASSQNQLTLKGYKFLNDLNGVVTWIALVTFWFEDNTTIALGYLASDSIFGLFDHLDTTLAADARLYMTAEDALVGQEAKNK